MSNVSDVIRDSMLGEKALIKTLNGEFNVVIRDVALDPDSEAKILYITTKDRELFNMANVISIKFGVEDKVDDNPGYYLKGWGEVDDSDVGRLVQVQSVSVDSKGVMYSGTIARCDSFLYSTRERFKGENYCLVPKTHNNSTMVFSPVCGVYSIG